MTDLLALLLIAVYLAHIACVACGLGDGALCAAVRALGGGAGRWRMTLTPLATGIAWIDDRFAAGAKEIGVSCNPIQMNIYLSADKERIVLKGRSRHETRIIKDILHEYIARLPKRP